MQTNTLQALTRLVGNHGGATAPPRKKPRKVPGVRKVPRGKAYGWHRNQGTSGITHPSDITRSTGPTHTSDSSRQANFQNALALNRRRNVSAPRRSAPRPPRY